MNSKNSKKIRKAINSKESEMFDGLMRSIMKMPFRKRLSFTWKLLTRKL